MSYFTPLQSLGEECQALTDTLNDLGGEDWGRATPAEGWSVKHQVAHLINVFELAQGAASGEEFRPFLNAVAANFSENVENAMGPLLGLEQSELLRKWEATAERTLEVFTEVPPETVLPWLVNDIPARVLCMAGTSEAFAHGQDVRDAYQVGRTPGEHVRTICEFGYHTRTFGFENRGLAAPNLDLRFDLTSPAGEHWAIGPEGSDDVVSGDAWDFALLVTRRRHPDDLDLEATTDAARDWMKVAQAYRGEPQVDRAPGQFNYEHVRRGEVATLRETVVGGA